MEENDVLLILLPNQKLIKSKKTTFQWIVDNSGIHNRNRCNAILTNLKSKGLIREDPKNWKIGQKKWFSLTEKGKNKSAQLVIGDINRSLSILEHLTNELEPAKVTENIYSKINSLWDLMVKNEQPFKGKSFNEKTQDFMLKQSEPAKPMFESLRRLHKILTYFRKGDVDYSQYVTVIRGDEIDPLTIPLRLLKGVDFVGLFWLSCFNDLQDLEMQWVPKSSKEFPQEILKQ